VSNAPYIDIPFGPYEPDWGGIPRKEMPGYLVDAIGVRLTPNGYRGLPEFVDVESGVVITAGTFTGGKGAGYDLSNGAIYVVGFSDNKIYQTNSTGLVWQDVTPASGTLDIDGDWVRFDDTVIYVCDSRAPVSKLESAALATLFADLGGSPPTGGCAARIRDHLVIGRIISGSSIDEYLIRTSAIGDPADWPTPGTADARSKQSISQYLNSEHGEVSRIVGGEKFGIVFQKYGLTRMTYVGGSAVFEFDTFHRSDGAGYRLQAQPITDGKRWYWWNETGVFATDGYSVVDLSAGRVRESLFLNNLSHANGSSLTLWFHGAYDHRRKLVLFGNGGYSGAATYQLAYNAETDSFSFMQHTEASSFLDGFTGATNPVGRHVFNVNGSTKKLQRLEAGGTPTVALQTGYIEIDPGYNVQLQGAHLLGTGTGSLTLAYKTAATSAACDVSQSGFTSLTAATLGQKKTGRGNAQYMAFRVTGTGAESQLIRGIRVYYTRAQPSP
jgi:hypothetical protein